VQPRCQQASRSAYNYFASAIFGKKRHLRRGRHLRRWRLLSRAAFLIFQGLTSRHLRTAAFEDGGAKSLINKEGGEGGGKKLCCVPNWGSYEGAVK
jgi:hypothetical protein